MTITEVREKFRRLAGTVYSTERVSGLENAVDTLHETSNLAELTSLLGSHAHG